MRGGASGKLSRGVPLLLTPPPSDPQPLPHFLSKSIQVTPYTNSKMQERLLSFPPPSRARLRSRAPQPAQSRLRQPRGAGRDPLRPSALDPSGPLPSVLRAAVRDGDRREGDVRVRRALPEAEGVRRAGDRDERSEEDGALALPDVAALAHLEGRARDEKVRLAALEDLRRVLPVEDDEARRLVAVRDPAGRPRRLDVHLVARRELDRRRRRLDHNLGRRREIRALGLDEFRVERRLVDEVARRRDAEAGERAGRRARRLALDDVVIAWGAGARVTEGGGGVYDDEWKPENGPLSRIPSASP
jgi:hypothetical protein